MRLKAHPKRSKRPHRLDGEIENLERQLYRLRGIRKAELSAESNRDPIKRARISAARKRLNASKTYREKHAAACAAAWTPERRAEQRERMLALRADPAKARQMLEEQIRVQRSPEYRRRISTKSAEVWAAAKSADRIRVPAMDPLEAELFGADE